MLKRRPKEKLSSLNKKEVEQLKIEEIRSMLYYLPIILSEDDRNYFKGCNLLHKNEFSEAIKFFEEGLAKS